MVLLLRSLGTGVLLFALAACNGSSSSSPSTLPNATSTVVTVTTSTGGPLAGLTVQLATNIVKGEPTGVISSQRSGAGGTVTFSNLPAQGQLCVFSATTVGGTIYKATHCAHPFPARYTLKFPKMP
jgi:hypothetical protein